MTGDEVRSVFRDCGAVLEGHFVLSSGLHSPTFLQKARVFMDPEATARVCRALAERLRSAVPDGIDVAVGPAIGGIVPAYETARHLGVRSVWVERVDGRFSLKRFDLAPGTRCVVVEDIVTTGLSIGEAIECLRDAGLTVVGAACIIDRSGGRANLDVPFVSLAEWDIPTYAPDALPAELAAIPATKPGSRPGQTAA